MTEIKQSIKNILHERIASPLYGTIIVSWCIWNWKILYLSLFVSESKVQDTKIEYIQNHFLDYNVLITYPLLSTLFLLTLMPFLSNGAYWLSLKFNRWKGDKKNEIERKQLLTVEQSIQLRELIVDQEKRFENLLSDKNSEIEQLKLQLEAYGNKNTESLNRGTSSTNTQNSASVKRIENLASKIRENSKLTKALNVINYHIQGGYAGLIDADGVDTDVLAFFESNELIENKGKGMYSLTDIGRRLNNALTNSKFE